MNTIFRSLITTWNSRVLNGGFEQWFENCEPDAETFRKLRGALAGLDDGAGFTVPFIALLNLAEAVVPGEFRESGWMSRLDDLDSLYYALDSKRLMELVEEHLGGGEAITRSKRGRTATPGRARPSTD